MDKKSNPEGIIQPVLNVQVMKDSQGIPRGTLLIIAI